MQARGSGHDDLLVSVALACWVGERAIVESFEQERDSLGADELVAFINQRVSIGW